MNIKKTITGSSYIIAAKTPGTTFYRCSLKEIKDALSDDDSNIWVMKSIDELGYDAIDFEKNLFGSEIIDDDLYICVTDGYDIDVSGEFVNPEDVLSSYDTSEISEYIKPATADIIQKYITQYEIYAPEFDKWAPDLLKRGYTFSELVKDAQEFDTF